MICWHKIEGNHCQNDSGIPYNQPNINIVTPINLEVNYS